MPELMDEVDSGESGAALDAAADWNCGAAAPRSLSSPLVFPNMTLSSYLLLEAGICQMA
jgi:hypothetical protein